MARICARGYKLSCSSPVLVKNRSGVVLASCGRCMSCCIAKQSSLEFLAEKELYKVYKSGLGASFVTLTYDDNNVPYVLDTPYQTLLISDFQKFMKRLRKNVRIFGVPLKYVACGEYGDQLGRPHYHFALLGLSDALAESVIKKSWTFGRYQVGALASGGLKYVIKYMTKSRLTPEIKAFYDANGIQPPFIVHSQKLGFDWIYNHKDDIVKQKYTFLSRGKVRLYPKYVREVVERLTGVDSRPFVADYLAHVNTHGETLDDFFARVTYMRESDLVKKTLQQSKAALMPSSFRRPVEMRPLGSTVSPALLAQVALE